MNLYGLDLIPSLSGCIINSNQGFYLKTIKIQVVKTCLEKKHFKTLLHIELTILDLYHNNNLRSKCNVIFSVKTALQVCISFLEGIVLSREILTVR